MRTDGWIILDKDSGLFSRTAGGRIARMLGTKKFGHIGTLDPMASGVLPIAIGGATKMIPFVEDVQANIKEYLFDVQFGVLTDTLDVTGRIIIRDDRVPTRDTIVAALPGFVGNIMQTPPQYSAVHAGGVRAYDIARRGGVADVAPRPVTVYALELLGLDGPQWHFRVRCSRGTYVRALARDIGTACGAHAIATMIRRTETNGFTLKNTVKLDFLEKVFNNCGDISEYLMPMDLGLGDIPVINLNNQDADFYIHGGFVGVAQSDGLTRVYSGDKFIGIGVAHDGTLRPKRTI